MENKRKAAKLADNSTLSMLLIILDTNISQSIIMQEPDNLTQIVESLVAFGNAHLMQKAQNRLAVISSNQHATEFLYPVPGQQYEPQTSDGQYEAFTEVEMVIKERLMFVLNNTPHTGASDFSMLAGSMAMSLCYITRLQNELPPGTKMHSRLLVMTGSNEAASQYMTYMNVFFSAQKLGIVIDVCALDKNLSLLQQGCDITGGQYLNATQLEGLLQYLVWIFLPDPKMRHKLVLPPTTKVDYRAACFCHREMIDVGYVCSVCLSIFCKYSPICTTCQAVFKTPGPLMFKKKKKR